MESPGGQLGLHPNLDTDIYRDDGSSEYSLGTSSLPAEILHYSVEPKIKDRPRNVGTHSILGCAVVINNGATEGVITAG